MGNLPRISRNVFKYKGRFVALYLSSPQEQSVFCDYKAVIGLIDQKLQYCEKNDCVTVILPFTLMRNRDGKLNFNCILKPIEFLKSEAAKVSILYLRKPSARGVAEFDELMERVGAVAVESDQDYDVQAARVERVLKSA